MFKRAFMAAFLMGVLWFAAFAQGAVLVLGDTPVAEFTLPDGSVLKNAFVWRRSSEGLMIVHDDGQYFLNFALLPDDWKTAYLGEAVMVEEPELEQELYEVYDPYDLMPILETVPHLTETGRTYALRKGADEESEKNALALGILQSLLSGKLDEAKRLILIVEEKGFDIDNVERDSVFVECGTCDGRGRIEKNCSVCKGTGKCLKCNGFGSQKSATGKTTAHCTACRGGGVCLECGGARTKSSICRVCHGRGRLLEKRDCEIKRDFYIHIVNNRAKPEVSMSVVQVDRDRIINMLKTLPGLEQGATEFYTSEGYAGGMDTNILVAGTMYSLLQGNMEDAEFFHLTIQVHYGEGSVMDIKKYLKSCDACGGSGLVKKDCRTCNGSGKCKRCGGDGKQDSEFLDKTISCTTCRGTGKCAGACKGTGEIKLRCGACEGTGRRFEKDRARIKLQLEVDELNRFYLDRK